MPVVAVVWNDSLIEKLKSNLKSSPRRRVVSWPTPDSQLESSEGLHVIRMPEHYGAEPPAASSCPCSC
jgi:glucosamine--fructose-6-phosphate aminotransferase (isomerizing)